MSRSGRTRRHVTISYEDGVGPNSAAPPGPAAKKPKAEVPRTNGILPSANLDGLDHVDNAAIALRLIEAGEALVVDGATIGTCEHDIPEGHRFMTTPIKTGGGITSWGVIFGLALKDLNAGAYLCNIKVISTFQSRKSTLKLPTEPTFENAPFKRHEIDEMAFAATDRMVDADEPGVMPVRTFDGIKRGGGRGTGTRNYVVVMGVSSLVAGFARHLEKVYKSVSRHKAVDGVVAVAHTEGGKHTGAGSGTDTGDHAATNRDKVLRTLAGFIVHPNVAGVLLVDRGTEALQTTHVLEFMRQNGYPLDQVPVQTLSLGADGFAEDVARARGLIDGLLATAHVGADRVAVPIAELFLAQQCGGSDAFSGISANPMAGYVARQIVVQGGGVLLAETDELMGAEPYVLEKLANVETGKKFLRFIDRFYAYARQFGHSPEGNPSGGNLYRGLYNITLKSCGAAMKKFPDVRLEHVLEYGERLITETRGYCFMDSPGNDLESIAGQVACGCNMIIFTTGNGAITNFPFVPTIKALTTTARYNLLSRDMDINAGVYLDGTPMATLGAEVFAYMVKAASGKRTKGELAGHHQVQVWREWPRLSEAEIAETAANGLAQSAAELTVVTQVAYVGDGPRMGAPMKMATAVASDSPHAPILAKLRLFRTHNVAPITPLFATERVGLILPTSLCSSHVSQMLADRMNKHMDETGNYPGLSRVVALPHTEGCGISAGASEEMFVRTILGYAVHPMVACATIVEHGCEKCHNDRVAGCLAEMGRDPTVFGYASVQLDGGIEGANEKIVAHFTKATPAPCVKVPADPSCLRVGVLSATMVPAAVLRALGDLALAITGHGGVVVAAGTVGGASFFHSLLEDAADGTSSTLGYGQHATTPGLHTMDTSANNITENMTGLGATGVEVIIAYVDGNCIEPHPFIPVVQITTDPSLKDADVVLDLASPEAAHTDPDAQTQLWCSHVLEEVVAAASRLRLPKLFGTGCSNLQIARGRKGISM